MRYLPLRVLAMTLLLIFAGCGTTGKNFNETGFQKIANGTTTKQEIKYLFGIPFKTGVQNGRETWIYEFNEFSLFGSNRSKDIIIVFNSDGTVKSHQYMTN